MLTKARPTSDPIAHAISWISTRGIQVERRTSSHLDLDLTPPAHPTLYLLDPGVMPPMNWSALEDWVRLPAEASELYDRADRLLARAAMSGGFRTFVDDDDVLRVGARLVPLSPLEASLVRELLAHAGTLVRREALEEALWPDGSAPEARALDNRIKRLRRHLDGLPLRIHTVRARGFLIEQRPMVDHDEVDWRS
ncbi:helix-turn-helix domain-containing protein [Aquihabitans sp. G128]|uniref:helix-turn-helix domain-containing protein n=1 Tax=Aquihabitans sp. G128 TaxID=2849779 RepID=UPI001C243ADC|nr:helix-turn-helix domain-containing protein [Aquihabitans sp. G128]QXC59654.1 helix-turn-helix domain-containing protein [Aquihabitans sp. G128]